LKPKKIHAATVKRLSLETAEIAGWLAARSLLLSASNDFLDDERTGKRYDTVQRGGATGTGPERAALAGRTDSLGQMAGEFMGIMERWHRDARRLRLLGVQLSAPQWDEPASPAPGSGTKGEAAEGIARRSQEAAGAGDCMICARVVSGSTRDRLREGRCDACRKFRERNPGEERPRHLWGGDSIDARCPNVRTHLGVDRRCVLPYGHEGVCADEEAVAWVKAQRRKP
jgi:hypothetical protein